MKTIYVDNNATTPVAPEVREAMLPYLTADYFNPSSMYDAAHGPAEAIAAFRARHDPDAIVVCLGSSGALLGLRGRPPIQVSAPTVRPVRSTTGAGDALFAAFCHFRFSRGWDPVPSLRAAVAFASWKVGAVGGSEGFLDESGVEHLLDDL